MILKRSDKTLLEEINSSHSLYQSESPSYPALRATNVLIYPLLDEVVMPYLQMSISATTDYQKAVLKEANTNKRPLVLIPEKEYSKLMDDYIDAGKFKGCKGIVAWPVIFTESEENNKYEGIIHAGFQCRVTSSEWNESNLAKANITKITEILIPPTEKELELQNLLNARFDAILQFVTPDNRTQLRERLNIHPEDSIERLNFMIQNSPISMEQAMDLINQLDLSERRIAFMKLLSQEMSKLSLREELSRQTIENLNQNQRADFLRAQIRTFQNELGAEADESDFEELQSRANSKEFNEETRKAFDKELKKLTRYAPNSPEYALQYSYLDTFLNLPWLHCDASVISLDHVEEILDRDHYALKKVKERIIEHMAVIKLRQDMKAPILCLVGPPGVGKTSLGKSVAEAIGRKYVRVALGGVHDEAEIRGHRRTYLGSMPGRIISALEKCGTSDPVMVLDEIDKLGADYKGDPQTALLEVLDPEQNSHFHDNFIDHDYDLSHILFIATANSLDNISQPLLDRMEVIDIEGYVDAEKIEIAKRHLVARNLELHGFAKDEITFTDEALKEIITYYSKESGVRQLERRIAECLRKEARLKASGRPVDTIIDKDIVRNLLGKQSVYPDLYETNEIPGVVTGLAWTRVGGEILFIEASIAPGKDSKLPLTGNLGDVMKESAIIALQYLKAHADQYGLTPEAFEGKNLHIHVPEGAVPKDGPSAGITMLTAIASAFTGRLVREKLAMTGEMTLRGKILPVGGIKEKILAAKRAGIKDIILSERNRKDIDEIEEYYIEGLEFHFVDSASEVLDFALLRPER